MTDTGHSLDARRRLGRNVRWLGLLQAILLVVRFVPRAYLARTLGPEGLAEYYLGFVWLETIVDIHGLAQEDFIPRNIAQKPETAARVVTGSLLVVALMTPLIALGALALQVGYAGALGFSFLPLFLASVLRTPTTCLLAFYAAEENLRPFALWQAIERVGIAIGTVAVIAVGGSIATIFWLLPALYLALGVPVWIAVVRRFGMSRVNVGEVRSLARQGLEFTGLRVVSLLYTRIDVILVERLLHMEVAGFYSGARSILDLLKGLPILISKGIYPVLSRKVNEGTRALGAVLARFEKMMAIYALPLVAGGMLLSGRIMSLLYGSGFDVTARIFVPFVWSLLLGSIRRPLVVYLTAVHRQNRATALLLAGVIANIAITFTLTPLIGVMGVVIAVLVHEALTVLLSAHEVRRDGISLSWPRILRGPVAAALIMAGVILLSPELPLAAIIGLGAIVYAIALVIVRGLDASERDWVRETLRLR